MAKDESKRQVAPSTPRRTKAQETAVRTEGRSILVSASAGTGKTRVLVDRCLRLVLDEKVGLDRLLVVTFTEAAAAEMRERIRSELQNRLEADLSSPWLRSQLLFLDRAQISTIHSFCLNTLRENFHRIGLDPDFAVIDPDEAELLKDETAAAVFEECYSRKDETGEHFQRLVDCYGGRDADKDLVQLVIDLHSFSRSLRDPDGWLAGAWQHYVDAATASHLSEVAWFPAYREQIRNELQSAAMECEFAVRALAGTPFEENYGSSAGEYGALIRGWMQEIDRGRLEQVCGDIRTCEFPRMRPAKKCDPVEKEAAKSTAERGRERVKKLLKNGLCQDEFGAMLGLLKEAEPHVSLLIHLVQEFARRYDEEKQRIAMVDFSDLEQLTWRLLLEEDAARPLRDRYEHVLVDEYQDINPIQDEILHAVSRSGDARRPNNLFMVGDVKQSIYRFRLAEPRIFVNKYDSYSEAEDSDKFRIHLRENFRSAKGVVDAINAVFRQIMRQGVGGIAYDESAELVFAASPSEKTKGLGGPAVELHVLDLPRQRGGAEEQSDDLPDAAEGMPEEPLEDMDKIEVEARFVAGRIQEMAAACPDLRYRDIVILLRSVRHRALVYCEALAERGIPVYSEMASGYFESMEIEDMLNLLRVIDNPRQDIPLASTLRSPIVGLGEADLTEARLARPDGDFYTAVAGAAQQDGPLGATLRKFLGDLSRWRTTARRQPLAGLIHELYAETGYLNYVAGLRNGAQRQANLLRLHGRAGQFDRFEHHGLARFLQFIENLIEAESDFGLAPVLSEAEDAVWVMSIHKSKGLEFPVVFLPDLAKQMNFSDSRGDLLYDRDQYIGAQVVEFERGIKLPTIAHMAAARQLRAHTIAEEMRILYVAMTRAKERLVLSAATDVRQMRNKYNSVLSGPGAIPPFVLSDARSMLDWVWPAVSCIEGGEAPRRDDLPASVGTFIRANIHSPEEAGELPAAVADPPGAGIDREKIAEMARLDGEGGPPEAVTQAEERIRWSYPATEPAQLRARISVSELKHRHDMDREEDDLPARYRERLAEHPKFLIKETPRLSSTERGAAVHSVMRHLDLGADLRDARTIKAQVHAMVDNALLSEAEAEAVDAAALAGFFRSDLGGMMLKDPRRVRRELPFTLGMKSGEAYPDLPDADRKETILLQGIIDCLIEDENGFTILDFKTDDIREDEIDRRIEEGGYKAQLSHYADAVERIFGKPTRRRHLCFLSLGKSVSC